MARPSQLAKTASFLLALALLGIAMKPVEPLLRPKSQVQRGWLRVLHLWPE